MTSERERRDLHNQHAPACLRLLMKPLGEGKTTIAGTMVILESLILGFLLTAQHYGFSAPHTLDAIYDGVQKRLERDKAERAGNG